MMRRLILLILLVALTGCATSKRVLNLVRKEKDPDPPAQLLRSVPSGRGQLAWQAHIGDGYRTTGRGLRPAVQDDWLYVADAKGIVQARRLRDGQRRWEVQLRKPLSAGPGLGNGKLFLAGGDGEIMALSAENGRQIWKAQLSGEILVPPAVARGVVAVHSNDGSLTGLDIETGAVRWTYQRVNPTLSVRGAGAPQIVGDLVVDGLSGRLTAVSIRDGDVAWEANIAIPRGRSEVERLVDLDCDPLVLDDTVYTTSYQGGMAAIDGRRGDILWQRAEISSYQPMAADNHFLYVTDLKSHVWGVEQRNGAAIWRQEQLHQRKLSAPVVYRDQVVVGDFQGYLHFLAPDDGRQLRRVRLADEAIRVPPLVVDDLLIVYGEKGTLSVLRGS